MSSTRIFSPVFALVVWCCKVRLGEEGRWGVGSKENNAGGGNNYFQLFEIRLGKADICETVRIFLGSFTVV